MWRRLVATISSAVQTVVLLGPTPERPSPAVSPLNGASLLSRAYFTWANGVVLAAGELPPIQIADLPPLLSLDKAMPSRNKVAMLWEAERLQSGVEGRSASLIAALVRFLWRDEVWVLVFKGGWLVASMVSNAVLLPLIIQSFSDGSPAWWGYVIAVLFLASEGLRSAFVNQHWYTAVTAASRLRGALRLLIAQKALRIAGGGGPSTGKAVNLLTADCTRMLDAMSYVQFLFSTPVTLIATFGVIWSILGPSALA